MIATGQELAQRLDAIVTAVDEAGDVVSPIVKTQITAISDELHNRLDLGVDHAVVALVGGTGSGKSSLFNTISGLDVAEVSGIRPTTERATACTWGPSSADRLLDFLGVEAGRRMTRESILDADDEAALHGLVLLDLPDHDSSSNSNVALVERMLPLVDVLVWVVDPQKYADHVLHDMYLSHLRTRAEHMLVVLNQVDTIKDEAIPVIVDDVRQVLSRNDLGGVEILTTSAKNRTGVSHVREILARAVARPSTSAATVAAGVERISELAASQVRTTDVELPDSNNIVDTLSDGLGLQAAAGSVYQATARRGAAAKPEEVSTDVVARARSTWVTEATHGLPKRWNDEVVEAVDSPADLTDTINDNVRAVPLPGGPVSGYLGSLIGGVIALIVGVAFFVGAWLVLDLSWTITIAATAALLVVGAGLLYFASRRRESVARGRERRYLNDVNRTLHEIVNAGLEQPLQRVLHRHDSLRDVVVGNRAA